MADYGIAYYPDDREMYVRQSYCAITFPIEPTQLEIAGKNYPRWHVCATEDGRNFVNIAVFDTHDEAEAFQRALAVFVNDYGDNINTPTKKQRVGLLELDDKANSNHNKTPDTFAKIRDITEDSGLVVVIGEVGEGDMNGVKLREFKNGTTCVSFRVTDDTKDICCKKFFKGDKKDDAQLFADLIKAGTLVKIAANPKYDDYAKETVLFVNKLEIMEKSAPPTREIQATAEPIPAILDDATQQQLIEKLGLFAGVGKEELVQAILDLRQKKFEREQKQFKELLS